MSFDSLPLNYGLPPELNLTTLDMATPPEVKSTPIRVYAINNPSVSVSITTATVQPIGQFAETAMPQTDIVWDIPCNQSPSTMLDTRVSTLNFRAIVSCTTAGTVGVYNGFLRSCCYAYFDSLTVKGQNGGQIENIPEFGLTMDNLLNLQMDFSTRSELASLYGFNATPQDLGNQGHLIPVICGSNTTTSAVPQLGVSSFSYSVPLPSALLGVLNDRMFNIGRTKKIFLTMTTANILPFTIGCTTASTSATTWTIQLTDFNLQLETIDIGARALAELDKQAVDGNFFYHGITYKTTTASLPVAQGNSVLPLGLVGQSVKSAFVRFYEQGAPSTTTSCNGKYDAKFPLLNQIGFNIGGIQYPQSGYINPLLYPSQSFRNLQLAIGSFNSTTQKSSILPLNYCVLSTGGTVSAVNSQNSGQDQQWQYKLSSPTVQSQYIYGDNFEKIPKRGILGGLNMTNAKVNLVCSVASALTNAHTAYVTAMLDTQIIHNTHTGDIIGIV
jgi:hypothetical protein